MAAHDRHGAWFARRNVLDGNGLGFEKLRSAMKKEFDTGLEAVKATKEETGEDALAGTGAVRGIGADWKLESHSVSDKDTDGKQEKGNVNVYRLSAQFPGPTAPREFVSLVMTSDDALSDKSGSESNPEKGGGHIPKHYMVISKPVTHPKVQTRDGFVLGRYESVELIREIPLHKRPGSTDTDGSNNPIEWIMVTRSDPGGGIPRFMVERGTPGSICADVSKFLDWACNIDHVYQHPEHNMTNREIDETPPDKKMNEDHNTQITQMVSKVTNDIDDDSSSSISSSSTSYESAEDYIDGVSSSTQIPTVTSSLRTSSTWPNENGPSSLHNEIITKYDREKQKITLQYEKKRKEELDKDNNNNNNGNYTNNTNNDMNPSNNNNSQQSKQSDEANKKLTKLHSRHTRDLAKLESKKHKALSKSEKKHKQAKEKDVVTRLTRERDDLKLRVETLQKANQLLCDQIGQVQKENTALVNKFGKVPGGEEIIQKLKEEM